MIIVASGHDGVDDYAEAEGDGQVVIAKRWSEVRGLCGQAEAVLLGRDLTDLPSPEIVCDCLGRTPAVIWVAEEDAQRWSALGSKTLAVWPGALDQSRLEEWLRVYYTEAETIDKTWALASVSGHIDRAPVLGSLIQRSRTSHGSGLLADLDWNDPQTTWHSPWGRPGGYMAAHERLLPVRMPYGMFVPAPAPWTLLLSRPGREEILNLRVHPGMGWIGFDMGSDLRNALWPYVLNELDRLYLLCPSRSWVKPLHEVARLFDDLRPTLPLTLLASTTEATWLEEVARDFKQVSVDVRLAIPQGEQNRSIRPLRKGRGAWHILTRVGFRRQGPRTGPSRPTKR